MVKPAELIEVKGAAKLTLVRVSHDGGH